MAIDLGIYGPSSKQGQKSLSIMSNVQGDMLARMINQELATFDGTQHANFDSIIRKYPHLSPDVVIGLIKAGANADTPGIESVASADGIAQVMRNATYTQKLPSIYAKDKNFLSKIKDLPYATFKGATRIGFAALRSPYDYITTAARDVFAITQGEKGAGAQLAKDINPANIFVGKTSTLGQIVRDAFDGTPGISTGSGFFVNPDSRVGKSQAKAMQAMGLVNGQSFTIGRGSMATIGADPNSTAYKLASGAIDAVLNVIADPSTYLGPGALTKVGVLGKAKGGRELAKFRKTAQAEQEAKFAEEVQKLKNTADLTPEEQKLKSDALGIKKTIKRAVVNRYSIAEKQALEAERHLNEAEALTLGKKADLVTDAVDPKNVSKALGLEDPTLIKYVEDLVVGGKQDEIVDTLSSLSATSKNHGEAFPGAFMMESIPEVGKPVPAVIGTDEFFVSLVKEGDLNIVDLAQDYSKMTGKQAELELVRRAKLSEEIQYLLSDPKIDAKTRTALSEITHEKFFSSLAFEGPIQNLADLIASVGVTAGKKNKNAVSMLTNLIEEIWKADGFSNVRAIASGGVVKRARPNIIPGGIAITAKGVVAAKGIEISKTLADSKLSGLLSVPKSLPEAQLAYDKAIAEYDSALAARDALDAQLKEVEVLKKYTEMDPELVQAIVNNPAYAPLKPLMDLELEIGSAAATKEFLRAEAGLVADGMGGPLAEDLVKVNKWLLGKRFAVVADIVAKETSASKIARMFNNKMDLQLAGELAKAKTADEVLALLRKHLSSPVSDPQLARSLSLQAKELATSAPIIKTVLRPEGRAIKALEKMEQALSRIYIRSAILPLDDLDRLGTGLREWMQSAEVPTKIIDDTIDKLIAAGASTERNVFITRSAIISEGLKRGHEAIVAKHAPGDEELLKVLQEQLRIGGKETSLIRNYANTLLANGKQPFVALADGTRITTDGAVYVHQFLDDVVRLPSTKPIVAAIKKAERNNKLIGKTAAMQILTTELGEHWRTAQLAFRISYVLRNIGEMQVRQYLSGHDTLLNHPLSYIAMMAANPKGNAFQKWLTHVEKYSNDVMDNSFKDPTAAKLFTEAMDEYLEFMQRNISYGDPRSADPMVRVLGKIYQVVESTHPNFYEGYSNMLSRFYLDDMMQLVSKANTEPLQRQLVQDLVNNKPIMINDVQRTNVLKEIHAGAKVDKGKVSDFDQIFLKDPEKGFSYDNINIDGVWGWLFNVDSTASYQTALNALMGTGEKGVYIRELLSKGIVEVPMGNNVFKTIRMPRYKNSASIEDTNISMKAFRADLEEAFPVADMPNAQAIWADTKTWTKENESILRQGINTFFTWSSKIENLVNFGPEYRMSYWDHIGRYAPAMNLEDLQQAYKVAEKTLAPIRTRTKAGKYLAIGKNHQTLRILQKEIIKRKKNPDIGSSMTLSDAHATASRMAGEATKALFYDASRTLDATNKARLIFPFLQAHMNTIKSWSKLTAENPIQVYKFGKAFNALTQPGTSAIYDLTHTEYDENDGFFYKDEFNTTRFRYPLLGNILGAFAGKTIDSAQALQLTAPVESLNLAFGSTNPLAPGVGPVAQGLFLASGKSNAFGGGWQFARDWVFPFGPPKDVTDIVIPAWLKKTIFLGLNDQSAVEKGIKGWAGYLASTGKYGDNPLADDNTREAMFNDARGLSRWVAAGTAIFQSILPATPSQEILNKIKTPEGKYQFQVNTILYNAWKDTLAKNAGDYDKSVLEFADKFGDENLLIILSGSTKSVTGTQDAWSFLNKYPDIAQKYATADADIVPYLFPGGEAAMAYYNWQRSTGRRTALTREDISNAAENLVYNLEKSRITNQQIAEGHSDVWYTQQVIELNKRYDGAPVSDVSTGRAQARADNLGLALKDKAFQMSPIYDEAVEFYTAYEHARQNLQYNRASVDPDLGSTFWANARYREQLTQLGTKLMLKNPSFSHLYYSVFAPLLKAQG